MPVQKGHRFGPQSPEHIAKRFAAGAGAQKGKKQSPEHVEKCRLSRVGKKLVVTPARSAAIRKQWADGVHDDHFKRQARFIYNDIGMRSNWERLAAEHFDRIGLEWQYEPRKFRLPTGQYYWPDFYLPQIDLWVEIKGYATFNALTKFDLFTGLGHRAVLVTGKTDAEFLQELNSVTVSDQAL